MIVNIDNSARL